MNIVLVNREYPPSARMGGIGAAHGVLAPALARRGHRVTVICAADDTQTESDAVQDGVRVIRLPGGDFALGSTLIARMRSAYRTLARFGSYRRSVAGLLHRLHDERPIDVIEFAEFGAESAALPKLRPYRVVVRLHVPSHRLDEGTVSPWRRPLAWWMGRHEVRAIQTADAVTTVSRGLADWFATHGVAAARGAPVVPNPVDTQFWGDAVKDGEHGRLDSPEHPLRLLFVGTVVPKKGIAELVDAVVALREAGSHLQLNVVGACGAWGRRILQSADARLPDGSIRAPGRYDRHQLRRALGECDAVVLPSWFESGHLALLEAMAAGAVVITTRTDASEAVVREGISGLLVETRDSDDIAAKLETVSSLPAAARTALGIAARASVCDAYSIPAVLQAVEAAWASVRCPSSAVHVAATQVGKHDVRRG